MEEVVLVNLPYPLKFLSADGMEDFRGGHLGLGYLAAQIELSDIKTEIIDCPRENINMIQLVNRLQEISPMILGITFYYINIANLYRLLNFIGQMKKRPFVVLGGRQATATARQLLTSSKCIDCISLGEGEITLQKIAEAIRDKRDWKSIRGLAYCTEEGKVVFTQPQKLIENLDLLPFPKRIFLKGQTRAGICTTRGCYGKCVFCSTEQFYQHTCGKRIRTRTAQNVVDEIEQLYSHGIRFLMIDSDNFLIADQLQEGWIDRFCQLIKKKNIKVKFQIFARTDQIKEDIIQKLVEVGLHVVFLGVETGIQERLNFLKKNVSRDSNIRAIRILDKLNVEMKIGFIPFDPYSKIEDLLEEISFLKEINYSKIGAYLGEPFGIRYPLAPFPGSEIYDWLLKDEMLDNNRYGYKFIDSRMYIYCAKLEIWIDRLKNLTWNGKYYYYAEELYSDIFIKMRSIIEKIIALDLEVVEKLIHQIIEVKENARICDESIERLNLLLDQYLEMCKIIQKKEEGI